MVLLLLLAEAEASLDARQYVLDTVVALEMWFFPLKGIFPVCFFSFGVL